ncbi:hypothetical protein OG292_02995 [Streptomyces sp. NBC_01511]|uniref:hypothetical protein n=1 Tax=Streptomyces sp. NBC_01511 TaxID=2903889 RepID=UPI0038656796
MKTLTPPSPAALALAARCRKAKTAADSMPQQFQQMPAAPQVSAAGGEVTLVVHPASLADWERWTRMLGVRDVRVMRSTGASMVVRCWYAGVRTKLVGVGVPALLAEAVRHA